MLLIYHVLFINKSYPVFMENEKEPPSYTSAETRRIAWEDLIHRTPTTIKDAIFSENYRGFRRRAVWITLVDALNDIKTILQIRRRRQNYNP